jgi:hypothetical protein
MSRNAFLIILGCLCILAAVGYAADRIRVENDMQGAFDRNRDGFLDGEEIAQFNEGVEIRERIGRLRAEAEEAQGHANRLRAQAEELEGALRRRLEQQPPRPDGPRPEDRPDVDRSRAELKERIVHLRELSEQAERDGKLEESGRLWKESEELERVLNRPAQPDRPDGPGPLDRMHAQLKELAAAAERAQREGKPDAAHELRQKAANLERQVHAAAQKAELEAMEREIHELRKLAEREKAEGRHDKAEAILKEAENLHRHLQERAEQVRRLAAEGPDAERPRDVRPEDRDRPRDEPRERPNAERGRDVRRPDGGERPAGEGSLEAEVKRLRNELNELREIVRQLHDKLADR